MKQFAVVLFLLAGALSAQTKEQRGKQIVDEALQALGGDRFLNMKDRIESGRAYSFYREQLSGLTLATIYTRYLTRPEPPRSDFFGQRERQAFGKDLDNGAVFTETDAWQFSFRGARPIDQATRERYYDSTKRNILYILRQRLGEPGLIIESRGTDMWEFQPVNIVDITDADNRVVTVMFSVSSKLPMRQVFYRRTKEGERDEEVTLFSKFRDVGGGVQWPFVIQRERNGEKIFEIYSESVTINQDLKDDLYTIPANMKMLKPIK